MEKIILNLAAPWNDVKERIKEVDVTITDDDLAYEPGQEKLLLERLAKKMGRDITQVKAWIESVASNKRPAS